MSNAAGLVMVNGEIDIRREEEFVTWYDGKAGELIESSGLVLSRRFRSLDDGRAAEVLALFEARRVDSLRGELCSSSESHPAPGSQVPRTLGGGILTRVYVDITPSDIEDRNDGEQRSRAGGVRLVMADFDPAYEESVNEWYDREHLSEQLSFDGLFSARRFKSMEASPKYLALYDLVDAGLIASAAYDMRTPTEWTRRSVRHMRNSYRRTFERMEDVPSPVDLR